MACIVKLPSQKDGPPNLNIENVAPGVMKMDGLFKENSKKIAAHDDALDMMANEINEIKRDIRKLFKRPSLELKLS